MYPIGKQEQNHAECLEPVMDQILAPRLIVKKKATKDVDHHVIAAMLLTKKTVQN